MSGETSRLHLALTSLGVTPEEIAEADRDGTILALAAERFLLPGERRFTTAEVAAAAGVDTESLARLWLALGLPQPSEERVFTDRDVEVAQNFVGDRTALDDYLLHETRVVSASLGRIAEVVVDEMWDLHVSAGQSQEEALSELATSVDLERFERVVLYVLRRHLVAAIYRRLALQADAGRFGGPVLAVGFADLAGFSAVSQRVTAAELSSLVVGFEKVAYDVVAESGGRVVKTLGDGVLFTCDDPASAADIALRLAELDTAEVPPIQVGLGWGPVLVRQGDCFGPTVNLVSRVVGCATGGVVLVEPATAEALRRQGRHALTSIGERDLKGFGSIELWRLNHRPQR